MYEKFRWSSDEILLKSIIILYRALSTREFWRNFDEISATYYPAAKTQYLPQTIMRAEMVGSEHDPFDLCVCSRLFTMLCNTVVCEDPVLSRNSQNIAIWTK